MRWSNLGLVLAYAALPLSGGSPVVQTVIYVFSEREQSVTETELLRLIDGKIEWRRNLGTQVIYGHSVDKIVTLSAPEGGYQAIVWDKLSGKEILKRPLDMKGVGPFCTIRGANQLLFPCLEEDRMFFLAAKPGRNPPGVVWLIAEADLKSGQVKIHEPPSGSSESPALVSIGTRVGIALKDGGVAFQSPLTGLFSEVQPLSERWHQFFPGLGLVWLDKDSAHYQVYDANLKALPERRLLLKGPVSLARWLVVKDKPLIVYTQSQEGKTRLVMHDPLKNIALHEASLDVEVIELHVSPDASMILLELGHRKGVLVYNVAKAAVVETIDVSWGRNVRILPAFGN